MCVPVGAGCDIEGGGPMVTTQARQIHADRVVVTRDATVYHNYSEQSVAIEEMTVEELFAFVPASASDTRRIVDRLHQLCEEEDGK